MMINRVFPAILLALASLFLFSCADTLTKNEPTIETGKKVSLEVTLSLDDGTVVTSNAGKDPLVYRQGDQTPFPALQQALVGLKVNDTKKVTLPPEQGFGAVDRNLLEVIDASQIPAESRQVGRVLVGSDDAGNEIPARIVEVRDDKVVLDLNHPLAGQTLNFDVRVLSIE